MSQALICAWCDTAMRPGTLPASHGLCKPCEAKYFPELDEVRVKAANEVTFLRAVRGWFQKAEAR